MTTSSIRRRINARLARSAAFGLLALAAVLCQSQEAAAQWATNGNHITNSNPGNVGVGIMNPAQNFHVHSAGTYSGTRVTTTATGSTINDGVNFGYDNDYGAYMWNREATPLILSTSNAEKMRIAPNGNVGIGTTVPGALLSLRVPSGDVVTRFGNAGGSAGELDIRYKFETSQHRLGLTDANGQWMFYTQWSASNVNSIGFFPGRVGIGTTTPTSALHVNGDITVSGNINAKYQDVAEWVPSRQRLAAGTVVIVDTGAVNGVLASNRSYDTGVAGVVSPQPGLILGEGGAGKLMIATTGRVKVKVDATKGAIRAGDLLVTSDVAGVAMRSEPVSFGGIAMHRPGTIIGKALESLDKGTGEILVLLSLQ